MREIIPKSSIDRSIVDSNYVGNSVGRTQGKRHGGLCSPKQLDVRKLAVVEDGRRGGKLGDRCVVHGVSNDCRVSEAMIFDEC